MKSFTKISTAILMSACALTTAVASESESNSSLNLLVSEVVKSTVMQASNSIDLNIQKSVLTNIHNLSVGNDDAPKGHVKIIDLASVKVSEESKSEKAE